VEVESKCRERFGGKGGSALTNDQHKDLVCRSHTTTETRPSFLRLVSTAKAMGVGGLKHLTTITFIHSIRGNEWDGCMEWTESTTKTFNTFSWPRHLCQLLHPNGMILLAEPVSRLFLLLSACRGRLLYSPYFFVRGRMGR